MEKKNNEVDHKTKVKCRVCGKVYKVHWGIFKSFGSTDPRQHRENGRKSAICKGTYIQGEIL